MRGQDGILNKQIIIGTALKIRRICLPSYNALTMEGVLRLENLKQNQMVMERWLERNNNGKVVFLKHRRRYW